MRSLASRIALAVCLSLLPLAASAQTSAIAGEVKDTSGAVLPGVTVEVASPALIEKVRTATTDGAGRYSVTTLRPGIYTVTFTLPGFSTVKRDGIELTSDFTATVNRLDKRPVVAQAKDEYGSPVTVNVDGFAFAHTLIMTSERGDASGIPKMIADMARGDSGTVAAA